MSAYRPVVTTLALGCLAVALLAGAAPDGEPQGRRGEYLVAVIGCHDCHTPGTFYGAPDMARQLAGSDLGWRGPWGVTFARNLTPDPETGLGKWSADDIVRALRTGVRPDGSPVLPPMPWPNYAHLSDADAYAIAAYLKSIPPIRHRVPARIPPDGQASGAIIVIPPPPAWDAPRDGGPGGAGPGASRK